AGLQRREGVGIDAIEEFRCIGSLELDLAQGRGVEKADLVPYTEDLAIDRHMLVFARVRIGVGAPPLADRLEHGAIIEMPVENGGAANRQKQLLSERSRD